MSKRGTGDTPPQVQRAARESRRREYKARLPEHFCTRCTHVLYVDDPHCLECDAERSPSGWRAIRDEADPWLGRVVDQRYIIVKEIGRGSSASVYQAESLSISRRFAIKTIATGQGQAAEQIVARLNREVEALGRLRNPHIVSFYEILEVGDKYVAAVMDMIDGLTLERLVVDGAPVSVGRACTLARQIANGLYEAHQAGLIHRDLKPENLIVERLPAGDDFVHILDFGIVHLSDDTSVGMTHGFIGTPLYASPEQAMAHGIDHRSDIYSLGAILFFMLTGRPPFVSNNVYDVLKMHVREPAPRLGQVQSNALYPEALESLVKSMLAKTPDGRPADLSVVIEELDHISSATYSDAHVHVATTQAGPALSPNTTQSGPSQSGPKFARHEMDSSATIQGFAHREPLRTPPFARIPTGTALNPGIELRPLPGQISYAFTPVEEQAVAPPLVKRREVRAACGSQGVFAFHHEGDDSVSVLMGTRGEPRQIELPHPGPLLAIGLSRHHLLTGHADGTVGLVSLSTGKGEVLFQDVRQAAITAVCLDPAQRCMFSGSNSGRIYIKDLRKDWVRLRTGKPVVRMAINLGADTLAVAHQDKSLDVLHVANPRAPLASFNTPAKVRAMSISCDNHLLAVAMEDDSIILYHMLTGRPVMTIANKGRSIYALDFSQGNTPRALCESNGELSAMTLEQIATRA